MTTKLIPELYNQIKKDKMKLLKLDGDDPIIGALATDGWKKKACGQGVPLISSNLALPNGGAFFYKVCPPSPQTVLTNKSTATPAVSAAAQTSCVMYVAGTHCCWCDQGHPVDCPDAQRMVEWCSFATAAFVSIRLGLLLMGLMLVRKGGCVVVLWG
jgi:hypothetical protein